MTQDGLYKLLAMLLMSPLWVPVLKALYTDFQGALWEEGGLFGKPPGKRQLAKLQDRYGDYESPLVNEPHETRRFKDRTSAPRRSATAAGSGATSKSSSGSRSSASPRRSF